MVDSLSRYLRRKQSFDLQEIREAISFWRSIRMHKRATSLGLRYIVVGAGHAKHLDSLKKANAVLVGRASKTAFLIDMLAESAGKAFQNNRRLISRLNRRMLATKMKQYVTFKRRSRLSLYDMGADKS